MSALTTLRVALEWTPNTIHTGLFLAKAQGLYAAAGLDVQLLPPNPSSNKGPSARLQANEADLAVVPSESCIAWAETGKMHLQAIYAILQRDASAVVSTKLATPRDLGQEGRVYGTYDAKYEVAIVREMVSRDGGDAEKLEIVRPKTNASFFDAVKGGEVDATWVFVPWEGVEAECEGTEARYFRMGDYGVSYGYSHVIARKVGEGGVEDEILRKFVKATREGYEAVRRDAGAGVDALREHCRPQREEGFLLKSQDSANGYFGNGSSELGTMSEEKWKAWIVWLVEKGLMKEGAVDVERLFTNEFHS